MVQRRSPASRQRAEIDIFGVISAPALCILYADFSLTSVYFAGKEPSLSGPQIDTLREPRNGLSAEQLSLFADILCAGQSALLQNKAVSKLSSVTDDVLSTAGNPDCSPTSVMLKPNSSTRNCKSCNGTLTPFVRRCMEIRSELKQCSCGLLFLWTSSLSSTSTHRSCCTKTARKANRSSTSFLGMSGCQCWSQLMT